MRWWCEHRGGFFSPLLFSALFGRPLAATIDLQVELMTKMTNPWGAQVREIMREMERDREGEQETKTSSHNTGVQSHTNTHTVLYFHGALSGSAPWSKHLRRGEMPHLCSTRQSFLLGSGAPSVILAWCAWLWQVLPSQQRSSATNQTRVVCSNHGRPRTVLGAWSQLGTDHSTNHWSWFNCVTLGEREAGENRSERHGCSTTLPLRIWNKEHLLSHFLK